MSKRIKHDYGNQCACASVHAVQINGGDADIHQTLNFTDNAQNKYAIHIHHL